MNEIGHRIIRVLGLGIFLATITGLLPIGLVGIIIGVYLMAFDWINAFLRDNIDSMR